MGLSEFGKFQHQICMARGQFEKADVLFRHIPPNMLVVMSKKLHGPIVASYTSNPAVLTKVGKKTGL